MMGKRRPVRGWTTMLADEVGEAGVVRVDGDGGVAEHGLGAGGGDDDDLVGALDGVAQVPEGAVDLDAFPTSRSEMADWNFGSQLTRRRSR